ncbi:hypothetical protein QBC47DRAFT_91573 [Echria macrotheca]|uniref:Nudix hydrolase domain-containing protein n=1 Tax=Echria macrotheca TaxID=438768 RepID=A0AAJ0F4S8_9PEZI|nr:hypothetical protein QBC47DRAFT_91573 [Echria macrotheca]
MAQQNMSLEDWLDDLCVRFIINLPREDLSSVSRICFQVEEAQWFYEDFIRPLDPTLPSMTLRNFCLRIFQHCPLLSSFSVENHMRAFDEFLQYKIRVPVRGAILLNEAMDSTVLVKGWKKGASWSFPRGKINKDEDDLDCAIREVYEETGFDIREAGLVPRDDEVKYIEIMMREQDIRLYVFRDIPMDTVFQPKTRKEISKIQWYKLSELPAFRKKGNNQGGDAGMNANQFYMVAPFLVQLKKWVVQQKKKDGTRVASHLHPHALMEEPLTEDDIGTQTEPVAGPSSSVPAIETLEGANLELQRLLKVQPPTQGAQTTPSNSTTVHDKGEALMALLRQKSAEPAVPEPAPSVPYNAIPHTPADLVYTNPPEPHTPHHHHPVQRLQGQNYQAPPNFPIPQLANAHPQPGFFQYARPHVNITPQFGRNPYQVPPRKEPVLLHPQPLPPQVQQSLLTRHILPTPNLPDGTNQGYKQPQYPGPNQLQGHNPNMPPPPYQQGSNVPPQLSSHSMSLLNAFKSDSRASENQAPNVGQNAAIPSPGHRSQNGSAPWPAAPPTQTNKPLPQSLRQYAQPSQGSRPTQSPGHIPIPRQGNPTDAHRSSLLDMFKKTGPLSPNSSDSTVKASQKENTFAKQSASPSFNAPSPSEAIPRPADVNGAPVRMDSGMNLPYRAVQILSRNKQPGSPRSEKDQLLTSTQLHNQTATAINAMQTDGRNSGYRNVGSPMDRSMMRQSENQGKSSPKFSLGAQAASYPYGHSPKSSLSNSQGPALQSYQQNSMARRQESNPEQQKKLLSLFSKDQASPTGFGSEEKGKFKEGSILENIPRPRSRVASLASVGEAQGSAPVSRRGSGTPISPADRSFLLSYLKSVSNVGQ